MAENDADIVARCLSGETRAFAVLVERYQDVVYNAALRILKNPAEAEDAAQCVFIRAYEKLESYRPQFKFFSWIYRMAINESLNRVRDRPDHVELPQQVASDEDVTSALTDSELEERVGVALMDLSAEDRALILLRHYEDLPYRDLGFIFEIPTKTVKSRLYTARQRLREVLVGHGIQLTHG